MFYGGNQRKRKTIMSNIALAAFGQPPAIITNFVSSLTTQPAFKNYLYTQGRITAATIIKSLGQDSGAPGASPESPWMRDVAAPLLEPFISGVKDEFSSQYTSKIVFGVIGGVVALTAAFLLGRITKKAR